MSVITLTFTGSEEEIVSGIPKTMAITSNVPATIYFTLDGSNPTLSSPIYTDTFNMPDGVNSVTLRAFGVDANSEIGSIMAQTFSPDVTNVTIARNIGMEGYVLARADTGDDVADGFDADGNTARFIDVDLDTIDTIRKEAGFQGTEEGTTIEVGIPDASTTGSLIDDGFTPFSTPEIGELFNPRARTIFIDNRVDNDVNITLRPYGSLHDPYREYNGIRIREPADDAMYISGGFVRRFYSVKNNIMVSYYFDHNENRYVRNIQELPDNIQTMNGWRMPYGSASQPLVFKWIYRGKQSSIG